jgi:hypothetical protein
MEAAMANDDGTPSGFLSRWSRRKADVREGRTLDEPKPTTPASVAGDGAASDGVITGQLGSENALPKCVAEPAAPTLADTQQLTPDSDFTSFMNRGVAPDVKNAAMKKLFADPHFNVMDRLDIYIDDYSQPDPLPLTMLRQMTSAKTLNLFEDEPEKLVEYPVGDKSAAEATKVMAQSVPSENNSNLEPNTHDHADLRLQPDTTVRSQGT